jgi:hypothetical protein
MKVEGRCHCGQITLRPSKQIWCDSALDWAMDLQDIAQSGRQ